MLRVTKSFLRDELAALSDIFTIEDVKSAYFKGKSGLGNALQGKRPSGSQLIKVYLTSKTSPGRILFMFFVAKDTWIPVLLRTKNDKVGKNLSPQNKFYEGALTRALDGIEQDLINKEFEDFQ